MSTGPKTPSETIDPGSFPVEPRRTPSASGNGALVQRLVVLAAILLFVLPLTWGMVPREIARWHVAAGYASIFDDDKPAALAHIDRALEWDQENPRWLMLRTQWTLASGDAQLALEDSSQVLDIARSLAAREAPNSTGLLIDALNTRAYTCALAGVELDTALENIEEAFAQLTSQTNAAVLDTRAYLRYLHGDYAGGLKDATDAVELFERLRQTARFELRRTAQGLVNQKPITYYQRELDGTMSVLYQHRGLLYGALEQHEAAEQDLTRAAELGYDPTNGVW